MKESHSPRRQNLDLCSVWKFPPSQNPPQIFKSFWKFSKSFRKVFKKTNPLYVNLSSHNRNWRSDLMEISHCRLNCLLHHFTSYLKEIAHILRHSIESYCLIITQLVPQLAQDFSFRVLDFRSTSIDPTVPMDNNGLATCWYNLVPLASDSNQVKRPSIPLLLSIHQQHLNT